MVACNRLGVRTDVPRWPQQRNENVGDCNLVVVQTDAPTSLEPRGVKEGADVENYRAALCSSPNVLSTFECFLYKCGNLDTRQTNESTLGCHLRGVDCGRRLGVSSRFARRSPELGGGDMTWVWAVVKLLPGNHETLNKRRKAQTCPKVRGRLESSDRNLR